MEKKNLLAIVAIGAVILLAVAGYFFYPRKQQVTTPPPPAPAQQQQQPAEQQTYGTLPELGTETLANPVGDKLPELNPVEKANPFRGGYTNPFE